MGVESEDFHPAVEAASVPEQRFCKCTCDQQVFVFYLEGAERGVGGPIGYSGDDSHDGTTEA